MKNKFQFQNSLSRLAGKGLMVLGGGNLIAPMWLRMMAGGHTLLPEQYRDLMSKALAAGLPVELDNWAYLTRFEVIGSSNVAALLLSRVAHIYANMLGAVSLFIVRQRQPYLNIAEQLVRAVEQMDYVAIIGGLVFMLAGLGILAREYKRNCKADQYLDHDGY